MAKWTQGDEELVTALIARGASPAEQRASFPFRAPHAVSVKFQKRRRERLKAEDGNGHEAPSRNERSNRKFCAAMMKAIKVGEESPPIGTYIAPASSEYRRLVFHPEPRNSGCTSAFALLADMGF